MAALRLGVPARGDFEGALPPVGGRVDDGAERSDPAAALRPQPLRGYGPVGPHAGRAGDSSGATSPMAIGRRFHGHGGRSWWHTASAVPTIGGGYW